MSYYLVFREESCGTELRIDLEDQDCMILSLKSLTDDGYQDIELDKQAARHLLKYLKANLE